MNAAGRLRSIDVLRGAAALAVVAEHLPNWAPGGWRQHPFFFLGVLFEYGYLGVPLFIVISGFCIHQTASRKYRAIGEYQVGWLAYWTRRTWRLYPPYVAAIAFSLGVAWLLGSTLTRDGGEFWVDLALHLLMLHNLTQEYATGLGNGAFWSLGTEEHLYLLYLPLLVLVTRVGWLRTLLIGLAVSVLWRLASLSWGPVPLWDSGISLGSWWFWAFKFWMFWMLGALAVDAHHEIVRLPPVAYSRLAAVGLLLVALALNRNFFELLAVVHSESAAVLWAQAVWLQPDAQALLHEAGEMAFGVACFCMINHLVRNEVQHPAQRHAWPARALAAAGLWSYSIYLTHVPVLRLLTTWLPMDSKPAGWMLTHLAGVTLAVAVGFIFHAVVERHFLARPSWLPR